MLIKERRELTWHEGDEHIADWTLDQLEGRRLHDAACIIQ